MKTKKYLILLLLVAVTLSVLALAEVLGSEPESKEPDRQRFSKIPGRQSLLGLHTISVRVVGNENPLFESEGLTWTQIKREIELMLQQIGIKTASEFRLGVPMLVVSVQIIDRNAPSVELAAELKLSDTYTGPFPATGPPCYNGTVTIELFDTVFLDRNQQRNCPAITYSGTSNFVIYDFRKDAKSREEFMKKYEILPQQQRLELEKELKEIDKVSDNMLKKNKYYKDMLDNAYDISDVKKPIRKAVNMFINDYLAANPKDSTTKTIPQTYVVPKNALLDMITCAEIFRAASDPNLTQEKRAWVHEQGSFLLAMQKVYLEDKFGLGDEDLATRMRVLLMGDKKPGLFDYLE